MNTQKSLFPPCPITGRNWYEVTEADWLEAMSKPASELMQELAVIVGTGLEDDDLADAIALGPEVIDTWLIKGANGEHPYTTFSFLRGKERRDLIGHIYNAGIRILLKNTIKGNEFVAVATFMLDRFGGSNKSLYQPPITATESNQTVPVEEEKPELKESGRNL